MVNSTQTKQSNTRSLQNTYNIYEKCMSGHQNFLYQNVPAFRFPHSLKKKTQMISKKRFRKKNQTREVTNRSIGVSPLMVYAQTTQWTSEGRRMQQSKVVQHISGQV